MSQPHIWKNTKKFKKRTYRGGYAFDKKKDRSFTLTDTASGRVLSFESPEKAKADGFVKAGKA